MTVPAVAAAGRVEVLGFVGTRYVREGDAERIARIVLAIPRNTRIVVGAFVGVDSYVALVAHTRGYHVHTVVPADQRRVWYAWRDHCTTFETLPIDSGQRARNQRILALSDRIVAIAEAGERDLRSRRSGTWSAVRRARAAGTRVDVHVLDGGRHAPIGARRVS